jgi:putative transposase
MPRKKKNEGAVEAALPEIPADLLDQFVTGPMTAESVDAVMRKFKKAILERALGAEMTYHLGYAAGADKPAGSSNHRNGSSGKTVLTDNGPLRIGRRAAPWKSLRAPHTKNLTLLTVVFTP